MSEQESVHITIFQAPYASLMDCGLYMKMHDPGHAFCDPIPAEYYLPVFDGNITCESDLSEDPQVRDTMILEQVYSVFNTAHPAGYCGRSLSVGDIVQMAGKHYLCSVMGFQKVTFKTGERFDEAAEPQAFELVLPDGQSLQASVQQNSEYPCINIDLITADGAKNQVCFVEYNPDKDPGHELCIGVYHEDSDKPAFYKSYRKNLEDLSALPLQGRYKSEHADYTGENYSIVIDIRETEKSYIFCLVEFSRKYGAERFEQLFGKSKRIVLRKNSCGNPSGHPIRKWYDGSFTIYPFQAGIPYHFKKQ